MLDISALATEQVNPATAAIDEMSTMEVLGLINQEDQKVAEAVAQALPAIAAAIDAVYEKMRAGGRLFYCGAGTSGRLGLLDAAECPPTFSVAPDVVVGLLAGGAEAFAQAKEGAEDDPALGKADLQGAGFSPGDVLVGIAASGRTPYVLGALEYANNLQATTIAIACAEGSPMAQMAQMAQFPITVLPGPEVITGSTRMKSGTAQKMVLNMISTTVMIKLGKTYGNLMVDVKPTNHKLMRRAVHMVCTATGASPAQAEEVLGICDYSPKVAIFMLLADITDPALAGEILLRNGGKIKSALQGM